MEHLFFSFDGGVETAAAMVFKALGMNGSVEGDSANSPAGIYFEHSVFGVVFKVEENVYDYEDEFEYMLSVKKGLLAELDVPGDALSVLADIASRMLAKNLGVKVGIEVGNEIRVIVPG